MIRVAVDAMGGDSAPQAEIAGALQALPRLPDEFIIQLVGRSDVIEAELAKYPDADRSRLEIHEAAEVIGMGEKPLAAVRRKPKSSIVVGLGLQKSGRVRRVRLRRQHRRHPGRVHPAARAARRGRAGHRRHAVSHRQPAGAGARRRRQRGLLRPRAGGLCLPRHACTCATCCGRPQPGRRAAQHRRGGGEGERHRPGGARLLKQPAAALHRQHRGAGHRRRAHSVGPAWTWWCATASSATWCSSSTSRSAGCSSAW